MKGGEQMTMQEVRETLEKQLQLLSERSKSGCYDAGELSEISAAMIRISAVLMGLDEEAFTPLHQARG